MAGAAGSRRYLSLDALAETISGHVTVRSQARLTGDYLKVADKRFDGIPLWRWSGNDPGRT